MFKTKILLVVMMIVCGGSTLEEVTGSIKFVQKAYSIAVIEYQEAWEKTNLLKHAQSDMNLFSINIEQLNRVITRLNNIENKDESVIRSIKSYEDKLIDQMNNLEDAKARIEKYSEATTELAIALTNKRNSIQKFSDTRMKYNVIVRSLQEEIYENEIKILELKDHSDTASENEIERLKTERAALYNRRSLVWHENLLAAHDWYAITCQDRMQEELIFIKRLDEANVKFLFAKKKQEEIDDYIKKLHAQRAEKVVNRKILKDDLINLQSMENADLKEIELKQAMINQIKTEIDILDQITIPTAQDELNLAIMIYNEADAELEKAKALL